MVLSTTVMLNVENETFTFSYMKGRCYPSKQRTNTMAARRNDSTLFQTLVQIHRGKPRAIIPLLKGHGVHRGEDA